MNYEKSKLYFKASDGQIVPFDFLNDYDKSQLIDSAMVGVNLVKKKKIRGTPRVNIDSFDYLNKELKKKDVPPIKGAITVYCNLGAFRKFAFILQIGRPKS